MTGITDMHGDLQAESSSHHLQGLGILWHPHYRMQNFMCTVCRNLLSVFHSHAA